ncbi:hypothetical protein AXF21_02520 [Eubacterium minutum ATCC 700079]|nr:hypothetical protein AXF21_02520 [Eubacterium minutum ATCC 700079]
MKGCGGEMDAEVVELHDLSSELFKSGGSCKLKDGIIKDILKRKNIHRVSCVLAIITFVLAVYRGIMLVVFFSAAGSGQFDRTSASRHATVMSWFVICFVVLFMVSMAGVVITAGEKQEKGVKLLRIDKLFSDIEVMIGLLAGILSIPGMICMVTGIARDPFFFRMIARYLSSYEMERFEDFVFEGIWRPGNMFLIPSHLEPRIATFFGMLIITLAAILELVIICSITRKVKNGVFLKNIALCVFVRYMLDSVAGSVPLLALALGIPIGLVILGFSWLTTVLAIAGIVYFVPKWVKKYRLIREGLNEVRNGNFDKKIVLEGNHIGEFERVAEDINSISEAQALAIQREIKNQRLKTELISNVSHDLRTPLTSMVSYVDLLREEGLDSENADEYLDIIQKKTERLQKLTEDLFEAAKASSGDLPTDIQSVQVQSIVEQALVETSEGIEEREVDVICNYKIENPKVMADGKLLWRVMENLLGNISKYALERSRAYIDVDETDEMIRIEIKNISKEPLNISADELVERFKRGDESRNTEGSGLGLAIARDLTTLMGGEFGVTIDGDLFKITLYLKKAIGR